MEKARILIVEDEEIVALGIQTYLEGIGHLNCVITNSGEAAISAIPQYAPDLVLMDISLAGKMSGIEAAKIITDTYRLPIVYLTAYSDEKTLESAKLAEPYGYIIKPFDERDLRATIEMALYKAALQDKLRKADELMESILRSVGEGIVVTGSTGMVDFMNASAAAMLGLDAPPPRPVSVFSLFRLMDGAGGAPVPLNIGEILTEGRTLSLSDCRVVAEDGKEFRAEVGILPLRGEAGLATGLVLTFRKGT
jgi:CheY-like chemotaxis protein